MVIHTPASALEWISFSSIRPRPLSCCKRNQCASIKHVHTRVHVRVHALEGLPPARCCMWSLTHHIDSAMKAMVDLIASDYWVTAGSDLDSSKCVAYMYMTREATIMELS